MFYPVNFYGEIARTCTDVAAPLLCPNCAYHSKVAPCLAEPINHPSGFQPACWPEKGKRACSFVCCYAVKVFSWIECVHYA